MKNPEHLDDVCIEYTRLMAALRLNGPPAIAYYVKEDLRQLWRQPDKRTARSALKDWLSRASGISMLLQFADTLEDHQEDVLAYYDYPISTGPLEGINNKIQTLKRPARGFRDLQFFKLKILALHQTKYALVEGIQNKN